MAPSLLTDELSPPDAEAAEQAAEAAEAIRTFLAASSRSEGTEGIALEVFTGNDAPPARGSRLVRRLSLRVPESVVRLFEAVLTETAKGNAVAVVPVPTELTTQQAADLMNVSRPYLVKLLDRGDIPHRRVGNRRRVELSDLLDYMRAEAERQRAVADELTAEAERLGLY
ncbi:MAG: DNA-binding protein [Actinomyces sp.]|nr:MAG: DNA-binding protein [Actinomyces sp.]